MADRDFGDRGRGRNRSLGEQDYGRDFERDRDEERYGRGFNRDFESEQYGRGGSDREEQFRSGYNRESIGSREWNEGWGGGAGQDWNRGGMGGGSTWQRGRPSGMGEQGGGYGGGFGGGSGSQFGRGSGSQYGGGYGGEYGAGQGGRYGRDFGGTSGTGYGSHFGSGGSMYGGEHTRWSSDQFGRSGTEGRRGSFAGRGPKGWRRSDERIKEEVNEALARHPDLDASDIEVSVENAEVTLTGVVEDRGEKRLAEDIAEDVFGVDDVNNDLKVRHGFLAGLTGEKADEREIRRSATREPSAGAGRTQTGSKTSGTRNRGEATSR